MPVSYTETRNIVFPERALLSRSLFAEKTEHMSRTIKAIERHMILPARSGRRGDAESSRGQLGLPNRERKLVAEWQRGAEILGHVQRKLRLAFARTQSPVVATLGQ